MKMFAVSTANNMMVVTAAACAAVTLAATAAAAPCSFGYGCASMNFTVGGIKGNAWADRGVGGYEEYLMIPYASARRFEAPIVTPAFAGGSFDATNILGDGSAACVQPGPPYLPKPDVKQYGVENCLILNLYKPSDTVETDNGNGNGKGALRPVLVWIFGGDNTASEIIPYNATKFAGQNNAVVITVSYRLGVFGFAGFEADAQGTANWGMHDVLAAIEFVKREHVALHVDTSKITVLGESSGATDSQILAMSPAAKGLVSGSISESGGLYAQDLKEAIRSTKKIGKAVGCDGAAAELKACMQKRSAAAIAAQSGNYDWGPTVDSFFLMDEPRKLLAEGKLNPGVNVLWGGNTNDSATVFQLEEYVSKESFIQQLNESIHGGGGFPGDIAAATTTANKKKISGDKHMARVLNRNAGRAAQLFAEGGDPDGKVRAAADALLKRALLLYPPKSPFKDPKHPLGNNALQVGWFSSDQFLCNAKREVLGASKAVASWNGDAYLYEFNWSFQSDASCIADSNYHDPESGSNHCDEMTFVMGQPIFDNQDAPGYSYTNCSDPHSKYYDVKRCVGCKFNVLEQKFSSTITKFWTGFANKTASKLWDPFTPINHAGLYLNPKVNDAGYTVRVDMGPRKEACLLWDDVDALYTATSNSNGL